MNAIGGDLTCILLLVFYVIKHYKNVAQQRIIAKEKDFVIASMSKNDQYVLRYICANFHAFIIN